MKRCAVQRVEWMESPNVSGLWAQGIVGARFTTLMFFTASSPAAAAPVACRNGFLPSVPMLRCPFRGLFLHSLTEACAAGRLRFHGLLQQLTDPEAFKTVLKVGARSSGRSV